MAATACSVARSDGRGVPGERMVQPAAMAPEVTTTTRSPADRSRPTSSASLATASASIPPPSSVTDDDPIFTTTVRADTPVVWAAPLTTSVAGGSTGPR